MKRCNLECPIIDDQDTNVRPLLGSLPCMPPKRLNDQHCTVKIDVWSLGVSIFQAVKHDSPPLKRSGHHDKRHHLSEGDDTSTHEVEARPSLEDEPWLNIMRSDATKDFIECCLDEYGRG